MTNWFFMAYIYISSIKKEGGVRFVTLWGFSMSRVSGRRSRSYNDAGGSPGEGYTMLLTSA